MTDPAADRINEHLDAVDVWRRAYERGLVTERELLTATANGAGEFPPDYRPDMTLDEIIERDYQRRVAEMAAWRERLQRERVEWQRREAADLAWMESIGW